MHFTRTSWQYRLQGRFPRKTMQTYGVRAKTPVAGVGIIRFMYSSLVPAAITHSSRMQMCKSPCRSLKPTVFQKTLFPSLKRSRTGSTALTGWRHFPAAGTRHPGTPSPHVPTRSQFFLLSGNLWWKMRMVLVVAGLGGAAGLAEGLQGHQGPGCCPNTSPKAARCLIPTGLAWPLLLGRPH